MACFSPTIATKRAMRSAASGLAGDLGGVSTMFITRARSCREQRKKYSPPGGGFPTSRTRRGGTLQAVVDRLAQTLVRHRHHRDGRDPRGVERAQVREQVGGGLDQVTARREVQRQRRARGAARRG